MLSQSHNTYRFRAAASYAKAAARSPLMLRSHSAQVHFLHIARPASAPRRSWLNLKRGVKTCIRAAQGFGSHDADSDDLLREFQQYADPNKLQNATKRLELTWGVQRVRHTALARILGILLLSSPHFECRNQSQRFVTAVTALASRSAHGAEAQVSSPGCELACCILPASRQYLKHIGWLRCRGNDGWRRAILQLGPWLQTMPHMQKQGNDLPHSINRLTACSLVIQKLEPGVMNASTWPAQIC